MGPKGECVGPSSSTTTTTLTPLPTPPSGRLRLRRRRQDGRRFLFSLCVRACVNDRRGCARQATNTSHRGSYWQASPLPRGIGRPERSADSSRGRHTGTSGGVEPGSRFRFLSHRSSNPRALPEHTRSMRRPLLRAIRARGAGGGEVAAIGMHLQSALSRRISAAARSSGMVCASCPTERATHAPRAQRAPPPPPNLKSSQTLPHFGPPCSSAGG